MKKTIPFLVGIFFITTGSLFSRQITLDFLLNNKFSTVTYYANLTKIKFTKSGRYHCSAELLGNKFSVRGYFKIGRGKLYLYPTQFSRNAKLYMPGKAIGILKNKPTDLYYTTYLIIKNTKKYPDRNAYMTRKFGIHSSYVKPGTKRYVTKKLAIILLRKSGVTTSNVNIRQAPSLKAKKIQYRGCIEDGLKNYAPKNKNLIIIARTEKKYKVLKWYNYWYLVNIGTHSHVWMFAEFVKIKK